MSQSVSPEVFFFKFIFSAWAKSQHNTAVDYYYYYCTVLELKQPNIKGGSIIIIHLLAQDKIISLFLFWRFNRR